MRVPATESIGKRYGRLVVAGIQYETRSNGFRRAIAEVICDCGTIKLTSLDSIRSGKTTSCGCLCTEKAGKLNKTHGMSGTPEHQTWKRIKSRCYQKSSPDYRLYGGRGIKMSEEWKDSFEQFYKDMGPRPGDGYSIERLDSNGNYERENCVWADAKTQANNTSRNHIVEFRGQVKTVAEWCEELNLNYRTTLSRLTVGWPPEKALTQAAGRHAIGKLYEYGGKAMTMTEWAAHLGIGVTTMNYRLKSNMPLHKVFSSEKVK